MYYLLKNRKIIPYISYLTYGKFWKKYLNNIYFDEDDKDFEIYIKRNFDHLPEYIYEPYRKDLIYDSDKSILYRLDLISKEFLTDNGNTIFVKKKKFEEWQGLISICSPIPIIASYIYKSDTINISNFENKYSILPTLELNYKFKNLHDLHIHMNGTSETYYSWEKALSNPKKFIDTFDKEEIGKNSLEQLIIQTGSTITEFFDLIYFSKIAREVLCIFLNNKDIDINLLNFKESLEKYKNKFSMDYVKHPYQAVYNDKLIKSNYFYELHMYIDIFNSIETSKNKDIEKLLHFYILAQSQFERILVQQITQNGFRQFLYISDNKVRDIYEDDGFKDRLLQLEETSYTYDKLNIEVRVTPGNFYKKYQKIKNTFENLKKENLISHKYNLSIICHFIKLKDPSLRNNHTNNVFIEERYAKTKRHNIKSSNEFLGALLPILNGTIEQDPFLNYFVGIDAAGYELYAPPEAFAPTFIDIRSRLKERGKNIGITFHAGEDFVHIISGIRYIYEAYTFLKYERGDRIGHANALGLDPKCWREKLNNNIYIKIGDCLDNLILLAIKTNINDKKVKQTIKILWNKIYSIKLFEYDDILTIAFQAYNLRQYPYDLKLLKNEINKNNIYDEKIINQIIQVYNEYLYKNNYDKYYNINLEEKFDKYITCLQEVILSEMSQKGIIIESMISSNVRISYYNRYREHHIIKWLEKKCNMPLVTLASDDPGIFNNNIFIEYSHLFDMIDNNEIKFNEYVKALEKNGEIAKFK
ncbi:hypothetical protein QUR76_02570 [Arcobacter cryaerophilus gv. pseudocryaerophilus]|uniref:Adenosine deaminase n=3 Tax=unclassified Arcobacter TaxID=2593671 RepID=A0AA96RA21_9BACT|nr:hypothetical protein RMQ65_05525 [Arcobacter sp. AZ-2023]WPD06084.1 hypothetical protein QUR76_02570 [Arcobacter sp. DSM 115956]WPD08176.1 hypothetical protein QUR78_02570 [Arcobacter sp. DSM 115955]WNL32441.1 hypothetical protein RMQ67_02570 [Arcobacter sp. AZ-2023]WNP38591.1 hypothetical protein RJG58_02570 [Arcobacter sp. AZ-2023]